MRLWTLHPAHLDPAGLVAAWREALLAKAVLRGRTRGYRAHPQLHRFHAHPHPVEAINTYLAGLRAEALRRGYRFDARKVRGPMTTLRIRATVGQLRFEWAHLLRKLSLRSPEAYRAARRRRPQAHPLFRVVPGPVAAWEVRPGPARSIHS
jgi:hypothetical protein